jgi:hypothetical protein
VRNLTEIFLSMNALMAFYEPSFAQEWNLELGAGASSPTPGISGEANFCKRLSGNACLGLSTFFSHNESANRHAKWTSEHVSSYFEKNFSIKDEYHFVFSQLALGVALVSRSELRDSIDSSNTYKKWCPSIGMGGGFELPIADLMGMRFGVQIRYPIVAGGVTQVAGVAGIRMGAEWFGLEN